jgi:lipooligosaccharide transport system permease protein
VLIPFVLFLTGLLFAEMGMTFTAMAPNRDYLNYYNVLFIRPMYMFSDIFFPIDKMPDTVQFIAWFSPLYHATHLCRGLLLGSVDGLWMNAMWLVLVMAALFMLPVVVTKRKFAV